MPLTSARSRAHRKVTRDRALTTISLRRGPRDTRCSRNAVFRGNHGRRHGMVRTGTTYV